MKSLLSLLIVLSISTTCLASQYVFSIKDTELYLNGQEFKIIGLRCSNALVSDTTTQELIDSLDTFKSYGVNAVSVFFMGSRFGDVKGYRPDSSLDPMYAKRMARIIEATDRRGMVVLVGCLYWGTSRAKEDLGHWTQAEASQAVANTVKWLVEHNYRNVFVDPDNEAMAVRANDWRIKPIIAAAHAVDPTIMVANNTRQKAGNSDLNIHFGPNEKSKPWLDSEATPKKGPGGYWGSFSKETHKTKAYHNYSRIGRYTVEMKKSQLDDMADEMEQYNGYMFASTWIQCGPAEGINGPFTKLGGRSNLGSNDDKQAAWNKEIDELHPDAGILWWLEFVKETYGPWRPPVIKGAKKETGELAKQEAERYIEQKGNQHTDAVNKQIPTVVARGSYPDIWVDNENHMIHVVYARDESLYYKKYSITEDMWSEEESTGLAKGNISRSDPEIVVDSKQVPHVFVGASYAYKTDAGWKTIDIRTSRDSAMTITADDTVYLVGRGGSHGGHVGVEKRLSSRDRFDTVPDPDISAEFPLYDGTNHVYAHMFTNFTDDSIHVVYRHATPMEISHRMSSDGGQTWVGYGISSDRFESPSGLATFQGDLYCISGHGYLYKFDAFKKAWKCLQGRPVNGTQRSNPSLGCDKYGNVYVSLFGGQYSVYHTEKDRFSERRTLPRLKDKWIGFVEIANTREDFVYVIYEEGEEVNVGLTNNVYSGNSDILLTKISWQDFEWE